MTDEQQARRFSAFSQTDALITRQYGGSGLGLAISRRLARARGGDLTVSSQLEVGTTFVFTRRLGFLEADTTARRVPPAVVRERPLPVVEDSETSRELLTTLLTAWSIPVNGVGTGEEGLAQLEAPNAALAATPSPPWCLMDMQMPERAWKRRESFARMRPSAISRSSR